MEYCYTGMETEFDEEKSDDEPLFQSTKVN